MNGFARCLVILAVAGHIGVTTANAFAVTASESVAARTGDGLLQLAQRSPGGGEGGNGAAPAPAPAPAPGPAPSHGNNPVHTFVDTPSVSGACGAGPQLPDASAYPNAVDGLAAVSAETEKYIQNCACATQACVADALDKYAVELKKVAPRLPQALRSLPQLVANAAQKVRAAPTVRAAAHIVKVAVAAVEKVVHKAIALMRAADPDAVAAATRGGDLVAHTLDTAATALERAETL